MIRASRTWKPFAMGATVLTAAIRYKYRSDPALTCWHWVCSTAFLPVYLSNEEKLDRMRQMPIPPTPSPSLLCSTGLVAVLGFFFLLPEVNCHTQSFSAETVLINTGSILLLGSYRRFMLYCFSTIFFSDVLNWAETISRSCGSYFNQLCHYGIVLCVCFLGLT